MDKELFTQIITTILIICITLYIGFFIVTKVMDVALLDMHTLCDNMTTENYNITPHHEACKFNETTGKYDLNQVLINDVRT